LVGRSLILNKKRHVALFIPYTLTSLKSVLWSVRPFSGRRNYFEDALEKSEDAPRTHFPCFGRSFHGTHFPWYGRSAGRSLHGPSYARAPSLRIPCGFVRQLPAKQTKHMGMTAYLCCEQLSLFLHTEWQRVSYPLLNTFSKHRFNASHSMQITNINE